MLRGFFQRHFPLALDAIPPFLERRVIYDREGEGPYLARFYIRRRKSPGGFSIFIHHFYRSDSDGALHNHPWRWAISLVLAGGYSEERREFWRGRFRVVRRDVRPGSLNLLTHDTFHRVDLYKTGAWSLFIAGPQHSSWGFWERDTKVFLPWQEFIARLRGVSVEEILGKSETNG